MSEAQSDDLPSETLDDNGVALCATCAGWAEVMGAAFGQYGSCNVRFTLERDSAKQEGEIDIQEVRRNIVEAAANVIDADIKDPDCIYNPILYSTALVMLKLATDKKVTDPITQISRLNSAVNIHLKNKKKVEDIAAGMLNHYGIDTRNISLRELLFLNHVHSGLILDLDIEDSLERTLSITSRFKSRFFSLNNPFGQDRQTPEFQELLSSYMRLGFLITLNPEDPRRSRELKLQALKHKTTSIISSQGLSNAAEMIRGINPRLKSPHVQTLPEELFINVYFIEQLEQIKVRGHDFETIRTFAKEIKDSETIIPLSSQFRGLMYAFARKALDATSPMHLKRAYHNLKHQKETLDPVIEALKLEISLIEYEVPEYLYDEKIHRMNQIISNERYRGIDLDSITFFRAYRVSLLSRADTKPYPDEN